MKFPRRDPNQVSGNPKGLYRILDIRSLGGPKIAYEAPAIVGRIAIYGEREEEMFPVLCKQIQVSQ